MNTRPVALYHDRSKASEIQQRLKAAGFQATLNDKPRLRVLWFVGSKSPDVRVEVPDSEFPRAENLLLELATQDGALNGAIRCPECGSLRVQYPQYAQNSLLTNLAMGFLAELRAIERDYYCEDCHFAWPRDGYRAPRRPHSAPFYFIEGVERSGSGQAAKPDEAPESRREAA